MIGRLTLIALASLVLTTAACGGHRRACADKEGRAEAAPTAPAPAPAPAPTAEVAPDTPAG